MIFDLSSIICVCWIDADIDGLGDTKHIYGITAVGGKVKPEKDVKVNYFSFIILLYETIS